MKNKVNKETLFKEYEVKYRGYLYGDNSFWDANDILDRINDNIHNEVSSVDEIRDIVRSNTKRANEIDDQVKKEYEKEIVEPLTEELLDLLQFEGLYKGKEYKKRAEDLKEKLAKCDGIFMVRERALMKFFQTKIGSRYDERQKIELILRVGSLDTKNI